MATDTITGRDASQARFSWDVVCSFAAGTPEHPFYADGRGWVEAGSLGIGTSIVTRAGPRLSVKGLDWQRSEEAKPAYTVYNFTVEQDHTFFVGSVNGGAWTHNGTCVFGNYTTPQGRVPASTALKVALKWLGKGYREATGQAAAGGKGVFVSKDGQRIFRMTTGDILGSHPPPNSPYYIGPHVHFQTPGGVNDHVPIDPNL